MWGATASAIAWTALQSVGGTLVAHQLRHSSELYGFFAVVLGLIFWIYLSAQVVVYGAEINVVRARHLWPRSLKGRLPGGTFRAEQSRVHETRG